MMQDKRFDRLEGFSGAVLGLDPHGGGHAVFLEREPGGASVLVAACPDAGFGELVRDSLNHMASLRDLGDGGEQQEDPHWGQGADTGDPEAPIGHVVDGVGEFALVVNELDSRSCVGCVAYGNHGLCAALPGYCVRYDKYVWRLKEVADADVR
jgi:hypothetical protein